MAAIRSSSKRVWTLCLTAVMLCMMLVPVFGSAEEDTTEMERIFGILEERVSSPTTFDDYDKLATMAYARGDYDEALQYLDECITLAEGYDGTLGALYTQKGAIYMQQNKLDEAKEALDTAETYTPNGSQLLFLRGKVLIEQAKYTSAIQDLERYVAMLPENSEAWSLLAKAYTDTSETTKATEAEQMAAELAKDPNNATLTSARQSLLDGDLENALVGFNMYLESAEDPDGEIHFLRAAARMQIGQIEDAISDLEVALALDYSERAVCYEYLSSCYFVLNNFEKVIETGKQCVALDSDVPAYDTLYQRMGIAALNLGELTQAETYFAESIEANDALAGNLFYSGLTKMGLEKYEEAIEDFTASVEKEELVQRSVYNRALCQIQLGETDAGISDLETAMTMTDDADVSQASESLLWQLALQYMQTQQTPEQTEQVEETEPVEPTEATEPTEETEAAEVTE